MQNKRMDLFTKMEELPAKLYATLAVIMMAIHITICSYTTASQAVVGFILLIIYAAISIIVHIITSRKIKLLKEEAEVSEKHNNGVVYTMQNHLLLPYAVVDEKGKIVNSNTAFNNILGTEDSAYNAPINELCNMPLDKILKISISSSDVYDDLYGSFEAKSTDGKEKDTVVTIGEQKFRIECHEIYVKNDCFYMLLFHNVTEFIRLDELYYSEHTAIAYIALDNLEGIAQYAKANYQTEANHVVDLLQEWAKKMNGVIREHERYKYIMICSRKALNRCIATKFEILDTIRAVHIGDENIPITVSMGIATTGSTLAQRENEAMIALDMAFQRGGDQVVLKNSTGTFYFGGKTKSMQKRSGGQSKIVAAKLSAMIASASNVIVMGHSNPDFDSIGACVGISALVRHFGVNVKIVTDVNSENFKACTSRLCELADYKHIFTDGVSAMNEMSFGTLVIVVDANNFSILEAPEIAKTSFRTVIIDHHIKKAEYDIEPLITYIDPSASSACELVTELLENTVNVDTLRSEEVNVMMAGIMVDTKNFTRTVGSRTFAAALYLRNAGASPEYARTFFEEDFKSYLSEAQFGTSAKIYRDNIAITSIEGSGSGNDRVAAAKAADKLLTVRQVSAAFALIKIGDTVFISARSDGSINVQLILERIGGGGHFDVAGAALSGNTADEAEKILQNAIDEYYNSLTEN